MSQKSKIILVFPPQWTPVSPSFSLASLTGQLKNAGYDAECIDLNVEFYNQILTKDYLEYTNEKIKHDYLELFRNIRKIYTKGKKPEKYTLDQQCDIYKFGKIKKLMAESEEYYKRVPNTIGFALEVIRSKERFYQPINLIKAMNVVDYALKLISVSWAPINIEFEACWHSFMKLNYKSIRHFVFHKKSNIFWDFHKIDVENIKQKDPSLVAISIVSTSQLISGLTLGYLLKKYTKAHVNIGGNFFGRIKEELLKHPEFTEFCDSITFLDGERPVIEMAKYINNEIDIKDVPNLIYFKNGKVYENKTTCHTKLNDMANINLDCHDLKKYFTPEIVMPYQTSRGCYWGKCTFCDQSFGHEYNVKDVSKVISEMRELKEKYGVTHYEFIDESVSPMYLDELAEALNKTDIEPKYFLDARLENQFEENIFKKASKSGLKMIMWGLESGSEKIMKSINKGIDLDKRFDLMKCANKYDIWNFAFIFFGYPLETVEDARMTIKMLADNHEVINSYGRSIYSLGRHSRIAKNPEEYGIIKFYPLKDEFSPNIEYECRGMNKKELDGIIEECKKSSLIHYKNPLWMYLRYREWLFLYIAKFGVKWVSEYTVKL